MIKTLQKMDIEGTYLNIVKATYDKPSTNIILKYKQMKLIAVLSLDLKPNRQH